VCGQSAKVLRDEFYKHISINKWAESNSIVVLYTQVRR
jgi:hypothetical protein